MRLKLREFQINLCPHGVCELPREGVVNLQRSLSGTAGMGSGPIRVETSYCTVASAWIIR